jgi:hypothetical protein
MRTVSALMFSDHMAAIAADHDGEFPHPSEYESRTVRVHGSDNAWHIEVFDRNQGGVYLRCNRTDEEGWYRWEAISYIDPF